MNNLKRFYERAKHGLSRPRTLWILALVVVLAAGVGFNMYDSHSREIKQQDQLAQLAKQQKQKAKQQTKLDQVVKQHDDVFTDVSPRATNVTSCPRLQGRPGVIITSGCRYRLQAHGKLTMAVVFLHEGDYSDSDTMNWLKQDNELKYINTYLKEQAKRYKVADPPQIDMTFYGSYKLTDPVSNFNYRQQGGAILNIFDKTAQANKVPEDQYDMVHYVLLTGSYGGVASPQDHSAFTYSGYLALPTFVHETLHLFGASDKYNNNDCNTVGTADPFGRYEGSAPGVDIMCNNFSLGSSIINDITAREIGWQN